MRPLPILSSIAVLLLLVALVATLALRSHNAGISSPPPSPYRGSIPPAGIRAPNFTLADSRGHIVTMARLRGRAVVVSFVDSKCTQKCPIVAAVIASALRRLPPQQRREVVPLLISVNPRLDTRTSIARFLAARRARSLLYLTGSVRELRPVWKAYGILPAIDTGNADIHSSDVRIFDRRGIWVSTQHAGVDLTAPNLDHDVLYALEQSR